MSIGPIQQSNTSVLDLFAAQPARAEAGPGADRGQDGADAVGAFSDALRDASKRTQAAEPKPREAAVVKERDARDANTPAEPADGDRGVEQPKTDRAQAKPDARDADRAEGKKPSDVGGASEGEKDAGAGESESDGDVASAQAAIAAQVAAKAEPQPAVVETGGQAVAGQGGKEDQPAKSALVSQQGVQNGPLKHQGQSAHDDRPPVSSSANTHTETAAVAATQATASSGSDTADADADRGSAATPNAITKADLATSQPSPGQALTPTGQSSGEALPLNSINSSGAQQANAAALTAQTQVQSADQGDSDTVNTARLTRGLANAVQQRGGAVTLRLTPPEMGTVRIQMQITGTNVSAAFHAETPSAQAMLTQQLAQLRQSLESQGMSVDRLSVQPLASTPAGSNASQNQNDTQQQNQNSQQQNAANDGRSRGQYGGGSSGRGGSQQRGDDPSSGGQPRRGFFDQLTGSATAAAG